MSWISVKDKLPDNDCECLVHNEKGWMHLIRASFRYNYNVFIYHDIHSHEMLVLEVTHYIEIPEPPRYLK